MIVGLGGDDTIDAGSGNDRVCGGSGRDGIDVGSGDDVAFGGSGADSIESGSGEDRLSGGAGDDVLDGGGDRDRLFGDAGVDRLSGGGDPDVLDGGPGTPDRCDGQGGSDSATACEQLTSALTRAVVPRATDPHGLARPARTGGRSGAWTHVPLTRLRCLAYVADP